MRYPKKLARCLLNLGSATLIGKLAATISQKHQENGFV
jgi:hypothetical protein